MSLLSFLSLTLFGGRKRGVVLDLKNEEGTIMMDKASAYTRFIRGCTAHQYQLKSYVDHQEWKRLMRFFILMSISHHDQPLVLTPTRWRRAIYGESKMMEKAL